MTWLSCSMRQSQKFVSLTAFISLILFLFSSKTARSDFAEELQGLQADKIILMIIRPGMSFRSRMDETRLPTASCVYEVRRGNSFNEVIETLGSLAMPIDRPKQKYDLRIGVIFKRADGALRAFYFNDRGGFHGVQGFSGDRELSAKADLPERLRAIAKRQDVSLTFSGDPVCPRA